ncbi:glycosyl hydrolase 53 family protein, partial [Lactobacillus equicursoris]|uniref:glycosyl hydrolase 53 family protein n=3 Tax=Lactobacillus equicursoris TaxID=420645 RepID=UPI001EE27809
MGKKIKHFKSKKSLLTGLAVLTATTGLAYGNQVKADTTDAAQAEAKTVQEDKTNAVQSGQTAEAAAKTDSQDQSQKTAAEADQTTKASETVPSVQSANPQAAKAGQATQAVTAMQTKTTTQAKKSTFVTEKGKTSYYDANGQVVKSKYFSANGKNYYADSTGAIAKNTVKKVNGITTRFGKDGAENDGLDHSQLLRDQIEFQTATKLKGKVKYDWTESKDKFQESAAHEMAQLLAQKSVNNDDKVISSLMEKNSSMPGKVLASVVMDVSQKNLDAKAVTSALLAKLGKTDAANAVLGAGYYDGTAAALLYKVEQVAKAEQATSKLDPEITAVYSDAGKVKNSITNKMSDSDQTALVNGVSANLFTGDKGTVISQDVLKAIFAGLYGDDTAYNGQADYVDNSGKTYHYQYWQVGKDSAEKLANFLKLNSGVKYGDTIKAQFTATLVAGSGQKTQAVDETPTSKKTSDEITAAYTTGDETGLRYESVKVEKIPGMKDEMARGVDISTYQAMANAGVKFYDFDGKEADLFKVLADAGVNWVRLRLWNDPYNAEGLGYGGGNTDEETLIKTAQKAKQYGMKVLLDFHYSDFWADPQKQILPKAWKNLSQAELNKSISLYTQKVLTDLKDAGVSPSMVQIGNEITKGAFGITAGQRHNGSWSELWQGNDGKLIASYLATAAKAVRKADSSAKIAVQFESPDVNKYRSLMTVLKNSGVDYDYLGTSYYPFWGSDSNNPSNLLKVEQMAQKEFGKRVVVMETSWLNNVNDSDGTGDNIGYAPSDYAVGPQGQVDEVTALYKALVAGNGVGAFYWEPAQIAVRAGWNSWNYNKMMANVYGTGWASKYAIGYAPDDEMYWNGKETWGGSTWDNMTLFDDNGHPLQSLNVFKGMLNGYESPANTASSVSVKASAVNGDAADLADVKDENAVKAGQDLSLSNYLADSAKKYLNGVKGTAISEASLEEIFKGLSDNLKSGQFAGKSGSNYHYEYVLPGKDSAEKLANFLKANQNAKYGDNLAINYDVKLVKDAKAIVNATSKLSATATAVWGLDNVTIDSPIVKGQALSSDDTAALEKAISQYLTGEEGTEISADTFSKITDALNAGVASNKEYQVKFTDATSVYHYVFYFDASSGDLAALNKGTKYGDPIKVNVSAALKWVK